MRLTKEPVPMEGNKKPAILLRSAEDGKDYLASEDNLSQVCELVKTFGMEVYRVAVNGGNDVLDLKSLAKAMCDKNYACKSQYEVLDRVLPSDQMVRTHKVTFASQPEIVVTRDMVRAKAKAIRKYIKDRLSAGLVVSTDATYQQFEGEPGVTKASINAQIRQVRAKMADEGYDVSRIGIGRYQIARRRNASPFNYSSYSNYYDPS